MSTEEKSKFIKDHIGFPLNNAINNLKIQEKDKKKLMFIFNKIKEKQKEVVLNTGIYKDDYFKNFPEYVLLINLIFNEYKKFL